MSLISPCGIDCGCCEYAEQCNGSCHAIEGKPFYVKDFGMEVCALYDCAVNKKGYKTCAECDNLPCEIYTMWKDPSMTDEEHEESIRQRVEILKNL